MLPSSASPIWTKIVNLLLKITLIVLVITHKVYFTILAHLVSLTKMAIFQSHFELFYEITEKKNLN